MSTRKTDYQVRRDKEEKVRKILERRFGMKFQRGTLPSSGTDHEFDAISEDKRIVAEVKSNGLNRRTGALRSAVRDNLTAACMFLLTTKARKRLLILTDDETHQHFTRTLEAKASQKMGIRIITQDQILGL